MVEGWLANALWSLAPTVFAGIVLFVLLRAIFRADRTERREYAKIEAEERAKLGLPPKS